MTQQLSMLYNPSSSQISFADFSREIPKARAIYNKYEYEYSDEYSKRLGRWIIRAEKHMAQKRCAPENVKQEITNKLITKLVNDILVSPYDRAPFAAGTEKRPVLFMGLLFPYWMIEDILTLIGTLKELNLVEHHHFLGEMLDWVKSLGWSLPSAPSHDDALVPISQGGPLVVFNQTSKPSHMDSNLLISLNSSGETESIIIKLLDYRDLIINAFIEMELYKKNKEIKIQHKQIVRSGEEQKALAKMERAQNSRDRVVHEQRVNKQFANISHIQASTQNIMKEQLQSLVDQMNQAEARLKMEQQKGKNLEAELKKYQ